MPLMYCVVLVFYTHLTEHTFYSVIITTERPVIIISI